MRNVEASEWLEKPALVEIRKQKLQGEEEARFSQFSLRFSQVKQEAEGEGQGERTGPHEALRPPESRPQ